MTFQIPESLNQFSLAGLEDLRHQAKTEYDSLMASAATELPTDEELDNLEALQTFHRVTIPGEIQSRKDRETRFAALNTAPDEPDGGDNGGGDPPPAPDPAPEEPAGLTASATSTARVRVADIAGQGPALTGEILPARNKFSTLIAAAGVPDYEAGQRLDSMLDVAKAFEARSQSFSAFERAGAGRSQAPQMYPIAKMVRDYPDELSVYQDEQDYAKILKVMDETRLPGGSLINSLDLRRKELEAQHPERDSLVAAQGWCAPSETDYDICLQITTDGMVDAPEVQARRGGVRHNTGIDFGTLFGDCATHPGYFDLTEAQVASGTTKTCLEIPCPSFVDDRLGVSGLCLTGNLLSIRGYPENTATFTRGALAALAHMINREQIADMVTGSTAVNLSAAAPWATDGSTVSQVLSAVEMAIVDIKYRLRLQQSGTLEVILPFWVLAQMRADWIRRNGGDYSKMLTLGNAEISAAFRERGARPQFVYDWQDAFATCAVSGSPGSATPISALPGTLSFLVYPAGTWVRAVNDVITLNSVYDSTKLATNQVTHLFTETGWFMMRMCPVSRVYTVPICPSGKTTSQGTLTCP